MDSEIAALKAIAEVLNRPKLEQVAARWLKPQARQRICVNYAAQCRAMAAVARPEDRQILILIAEAFDFLLAQQQTGGAPLESAQNTRGPESPGTAAKLRA